VTGRFPNQASPNETLYRLDPETGEVSYYEVYDGEGLPLKRVDLTPDSVPHGDIPPPHVEEYRVFRNPDDPSKFSVKPVLTRGARPDEIPTPRALLDASTSDTTANPSQTPGIVYTLEGAR
jgi:hypothetical protein